MVFVFGVLSSSHIVFVIPPHSPQTLTQSYGGTTSAPRVQYTLLPLARKGPTVVLDYDDWTAQCVWPDTTALGVVVMGSERFAEDAPSLPTFKSTAGSMHGGNASGKQRVVHEHAFRMHIAPATDTQEAGLLVQQLRGALVEQCRRERSVGGMEGGGAGGGRVRATGSAWYAVWVWLGSFVEGTQ